MAPSRHRSITGHSAQMALARAMSCSSSEKNTPDSDASPSRHCASSHHASSNCSLLSGANMWLPFRVRSPPWGCGRCRCRVGGCVGPAGPAGVVLLVLLQVRCWWVPPARTWPRKAERPPGEPGGLSETVLRLSGDSGRRLLPAPGGLGGEHGHRGRVDLVDGGVD